MAPTPEAWMKARISVKIMKKARWSDLGAETKCVGPCSVLRQLQYKYNFVYCRRKLEIVLTQGHQDHFVVWEAKDRGAYLQNTLDDIILIHGSCTAHQTGFDRAKYLGAAPC